MTVKKKIMLYNTADREKVEFSPQQDGIVTFYSCGQTIYEDIHVGNAKTYVAWDVLTRFLRHIGYKVKWVQNITDVGHLTDDSDQGEDKIEKKARELKEHPMELVDRQIRRYYEDMDTINMMRPDIQPRATGHIPEMIESVETLLGKDYAYEVDNSVYFDTEKFDDYGNMARINLDNQEVGVRDEVKVIEDKKNPRDFALWIHADPEHIMKYTSPWGKGYPGWHLECSVMAQKYLGDTIDIHSGGIDHIPVHHTNEIAQAEAASGKKFVRYWLHSEFITINGEKMSKSKGNFITLRELINKIGPGATRLVLTQAQYRTQSDFSMDKATSAQSRYDRMIRVYHLGLQSLVLADKLSIANYNERLDNTESVDEESLSSFEDALADDLNTPKALIVVNQVVDQIEDTLEKNNLQDLEMYISTFEIMMDVLGIPVVELDPDEIKHIQQLIDHRIELRDEKKYEASDAIRDYLQDNNYKLNDLTKNSTEWYKIDHK